MINHDLRLLLTLAIIYLLQSKNGRARIWTTCLGNNCEITCAIEKLIFLKKKVTYFLRLRSKTHCETEPSARLHSKTHREKKLKVSRHICVPKNIKKKAFQQSPQKSLFNNQSTRSKSLLDGSHENRFRNDGLTVNRCCMLVRVVARNRGEFRVRVEAKTYRMR